MLKAFFQVLRTTAICVGITVGVFGVIPFIIHVSRGAAPLDAAEEALMMASGSGGIVGLLLMCVLSFQRICPECRKFALVITGRTRMQQETTVRGRNYEEEFHEHKCEQCGYAEWVVHPAG